jgi:alcohol dehydrogenase
MLALTFKNNTLALDPHHPEPTLPPGEALIRPTLLGVCSTDIELCKGYMNFNGILGHEFVGIVQAVANPADSHWLSKRVVGTINCPAKACDFTARGIPEHARSRTVLGILNRNGCFADRFTLPVANLLHVPDSLPDEKAVFTEPLAAAFEILTQVTIQPTDKVTILGDGRLGLLCAQVLATKSNHVQVVGKHDKKLALARSWGLKTTHLANFTPQQDQDFVVDATASDSGFPTALAATRPRGTIILKTTVATRPDAPPINLAPIVINELTVIGSRCGPFQTALDALNHPLSPIRVTDLISLTLPLSQAVEALSLAKSKDNLKILLKP